MTVDFGRRPSCLADSGGKLTNLGISRVFHEPNPILVIDVVGGENHWHFWHTLLRL
jgi:hypothetical protein